jgi:hypothetical protein
MRFHLETFKQNLSFSWSNYNLTKIGLQYFAVQMWAPLPLSQTPFDRLGIQELDAILFLLCVSCVSVTQGHIAKFFLIKVYF